jgi:hypothetical protein
MTITPTFVAEDAVRSVCERQCKQMLNKISQPNYAKKLPNNSHPSPFKWAIGVFLRPAKSVNHFARRDFTPD